MSEIEEGIVARAKAVSAVTTIIGAAAACRFHNLLPKNVTYPCVQYEQMGYEANTAMGDDPKLANALYRFHCYDNSYSGAKALARAIQNAFQRYRGTVATMVIQDIFIENKNDIYEETPKVWDIAIDFRIHFEES